MTHVVVPVRYPLSDHSQKTLAHAIDVADEEDAALTVLHVNLYQSNREVTRRDLKREIESTFGPLENTRYTIRGGLLIEESILDEIAAQDADIVVIGKKQVGRWRKMIRRLVDDPDIETFLRDELDCDVVTAEI